MKLKVSYPIIVEGKYDKIKLSSIIDGIIIETNGFRIFKDKEKRNLIRLLSKKSPLIIATDSDKAGFVIRNYIKNIVGQGELINIYIPQIIGKEPRKDSHSKEGLIGVEGINVDILKDLFSKVQLPFSENTTKQITKLQLYDDGFIGMDNSSALRLNLLKKLNLPTYISTNSLLDIINGLITFDEYSRIKEELRADLQP